MSSPTIAPAMPPSPEQGSERVAQQADETQQSAPESFVIYSPAEFAVSDEGAGFWSNEDGWTTLPGATRFAASEIADLSLPASAGQDAVWLTESQAQAAHGELSGNGCDGVLRQAPERNR